MAASDQPNAQSGPSIASFPQTIRLSTMQAQKLYQRSFNRTANSIYQIDVMIRILCNEEKAQQAEEALHARVNRLEESLTDSLNQYRKALEDKGVVDMPDYDNPLEDRVKITCPHVARYTGLMRMLDECIKQIDALWIMGGVSNAERDREIFYLVRLFRRFNTSTIQLQTSAIREGRRRMENIESSSKDEAGG